MFPQHAHPATPSAAPLAPLVVDLDGTLTPTDTLVESLLRLSLRRPWLLISLLPRLLAGRCALKEWVAAHLDWAGQDIPLHGDVVQFLEAQAREGRELVLATAAHRRIADTVAARLPLFRTVLASGQGVNLKGVAKLAAIRAAVGPRFVYAGDAAADVPIWRQAERAVLVGTSSGVRQRVAAAGVPIEREFPRRSAGLAVWARALRVHQWLKNVLVFVPLLAAQLVAQLDPLLHALVAFAAFSLVASATYLLNDLLDLDHDRQHPRKCRRPLASGAIPIPQALGAGVLLAGGGALLAAWLGRGFCLLLAFYVLTTLAYSFVLKRHMVADVMALACLYTLRIVAGAAAIDVRLTAWLLAFSVFLFLSLALVKRCAELVVMEQSGRFGAPGRGYVVTDLRVLWPMGLAAALSAVIVMGLYIVADETRLRFASPDLLWIAALGLLYWLTRLWIKTSRGEMNDDPIVYALRDGASRLTLAVVLLDFALAATWKFPA